MFAQRYQDVQTRVRAACARVGRNPKDVTIVAVSKKQTIDTILQAYEMGIRDFGENYVQELLVKIQALPKDIRWHYIGELQSKKIKSIVEHVSMIHSLSRKSQVKALMRAKEQGMNLPQILLQLNIANESTKSGILLAELEQFAFGLPDLPIAGLMSFPPYRKSLEEVRPFFVQTRKALDHMPTPMGSFLSMGVSNDFETAIEEGATHIRLGTVLFGARGQ